MAMASRTPVLGAGCPKNRRLADSNPKSKKRIPFALIHFALVRSFISGYVAEQQINGPRLWLEGIP